MPSFDIKPYRLENSLQNYAWGTKNSAAFIPKLLGFEPEKDKPYAELWMGAHPKAPSIVQDSSNKLPLDQLINRYPQLILGESVSKQFNQQLPFLFKVLSAEEALSIQAHPNKAQAEELHRHDPQNYPDENHKPEIAVALDKMMALVGFREFSEIIAALRHYPEIARFIGEDITNKFINAQHDESRQKGGNLKKLYTTLLTNAMSKPDYLHTTLSDLENRLRKIDNPLGKRDQLFIELKKQYGNDVGLYSLYLLNLVKLQKGQGVFLKAGVPHAYLKGNIIECMANSDNVVRAGLTPKFKDIKTMGDILSFDMRKPDIIDDDKQLNIFDFKLTVPEFCLSRIYLKGKRIVLKNSTIRIMIMMSGSATLVWDDGELEVLKGQTVMLPAALKRFELMSPNIATIYSSQAPG